MTMPVGQTEPTNEDLLPASQSGTTSQEGKATSKSGKKVTLSQEEYQKLSSDARSKEGRSQTLRQVEAERDNLKGQLTSVTERLNELETDSRNRRYEEARNQGGDALTLFQRNEDTARRERAIADKEKNIRQRELQIQENETSFNTRRADLLIPLTASKYGLKTEDLADFKGVTDEAILDRIAQRISGKKPEAETTEIKMEEGEQPFQPVAFQSSGAGVKSKIQTTEQAEKASMDELAEQLVRKPSK